MVSKSDMGRILCNASRGWRARSSDAKLAGHEIQKNSDGLGVVGFFGQGQDRASKVAFGFWIGDLAWRAHCHRPAACCGNSTTTFASRSLAATPAKIASAERLPGLRAGTMFGC